MNKALKTCRKIRDEYNNCAKIAPVTTKYGLTAGYWAACGALMMGAPVVVPAVLIAVPATAVAGFRYAGKDKLKNAAQSKSEVKTPKTFKK
ncbi:MAG: hypothetical protein ACQEQL_06400 [Pseudomonadota bacterium]